MISFSALPLLKPQVFGCPYHGLVQGGELLLPNEETISYPQPEMRTYPYTCGETHLIAIPGAPGAQRSEEQQAEDSAQGWQWLDKAILAGGRQQLHGTNVNGWVYVDPNGDRWRVVHPFTGAVFDITAPYSANLSLHRFGVFGGEPATHSRPMSLSDWGQSTPDLGTLSNVRLRLESVSSDGTAAIIMIYVDAPGSSLPFYRAPLGFLLLEISGAAETATVSLSVLRTRAQTVGEVQNDTTSTPAFYYNCLVHDYSTNEVGGFPDCTGYLDRINAASDGGWEYWGAFEDEDTLPAITCPSAVTGQLSPRESLEAVAGTYTQTSSYQRLLGMCFDAEDNIIEMAQEVEWESITTLPQPTVQASGEHVVRLPHASAGSAACNYGEPEVIQDDRAWVVSRTVSSTEIMTYRLRVGAQSMEVTGTITASRYQEWSADAEGFDQSQSESVSFSGAGYTEHLNFAPAVGDTPIFRQGTSQGGIGMTPGASGTGFGAEDNVYWYLDQRTYQWGPIRWSNNMLGIAARNFPISDPARRLYFGALSPEGSETGSPIDVLGSDEAQPVYGSYNPITGEMAWGHTTPVCWV